MWLAIALFSALHLYSIERGPKWLFYISKPLPIWMLAAFLTVEYQSFYSNAIVLALLVSSLGDILLMSPKDRFLSGLSVFLLAHLIYTVTFWLQIDTNLSLWLPFLLGCIGVIVYLLLLPSLDEVKLPVAIYFVVILLMAWSAIEFWRTSHSQAAVFAVMGALIFIISDLVLAIDRFRSSSRFSKQVIMTTYYTAQALFTLSVVASVNLYLAQ
ncbi:lysoplasmalogenase [Vibrio sonorensis]|uniref:lysoplasmalogenase n=1 Tax=Vibrio sonorensis TaxID=1004316 RepID=UPI0008D94315|nr:lysoplasmalogenase [Vibrio sonorensis]